jgi:ABC-type multidrug transport system ATPase subunit
MKTLDCSDVCKQYGDRTVLDHVELAVEQGEFFGLVGMNGSGKSTLIKAVLDLIAIDKGNIWINGAAHRSINARRDIVYLPDRFSPPIHLRCQDFLAYMLELHGAKRNRDEIVATLGALDLDSSVLSMSVGKLSKGMTQKLGIASCLLSGKRFMILDEPMSGLDPKSRVLFKRCLAGQRQHGVTLFFSSHVLADVEELSDSMAVLHMSRVVYTGTTGDFISRYGGDNLEQAYMASIGSAA